MTRDGLESLGRCESVREHRRAARWATVTRQAGAVSYTLEERTLPASCGARADERYHVVVVCWEGCTFVANPKTGLVSWSDSWGRALEAESAGVLTHRFGGPATYGHTDYLVPSAVLGQLALAAG